MSNASDLLTKSSYCRNSKHAKCKTAGCECKCHAPEETTVTAEKIETLIDAENGGNENRPSVKAKQADELAARRGPTDAAQLIADRLDPAKAPAPKPAKKAKAPKAAKEPKPVVKGTVDGKLSNAHKRAIRVQMVAYLAAMPVELTGDLEGVTPEEAAGYVDTYWVKYIDPARDKARHAK